MEQHADCQERVVVSPPSRTKRRKKHTTPLSNEIISCSFYATLRPSIQSHSSCRPSYHIALPRFVSYSSLLAPAPAPLCLHLGHVSYTPFLFSTSFSPYPYPSPSIRFVLVIPVLNRMLLCLCVLHYFHVSTTTYVFGSTLLFPLCLVSCSPHHGLVPPHPLLPLYPLNLPYAFSPKCHPPNVKC